MYLPNESKTRLVYALILLAIGSPYLLASAAPPQVAAIQTANAPVPAGAILPFGGTIAPPGYLMCDGAEVQRSGYSRLFAVVGESFGAATNFPFTLPDMRGRFLRGVDGAATNDPDHNTRTAMAPGGNVANNVGTVQGDARRGISGIVAGTTSTAGNHTHNIETD